MEEQIIIFLKETLIFNFFLKNSILENSKEIICYRGAEITNLPPNAIEICILRLFNRFIIK